MVAFLMVYVKSKPAIKSTASWNFRAFYLKQEKSGKLLFNNFLPCLHFAVDPKKAALERLCLDRQRT